VWDAEKGRKLYQLKRAVSGVRVMAFTPDGKRLVLVSGGEVRLYDAATGKGGRALTREDLRAELGLDPYCFPQVSADGRLLAFSGLKGLSVWDLRTGKRLAYRAGVRGPACFSADSKWLACSARRAIHLLKARTLAVVRVCEAHHEMRGTYALTFSPDGKRLALGGEHAISLWDVATGKRIHPPDGHLSVVRSLAFSPDGRRLASGGQDGTAYVWDLTTSRPVHAFRGHYSAAAGLAFAPDGRLLATGDGPASYALGAREAQVRLFDLKTGRLVRQFCGHLTGVHTLHFSPDGKRLATAGWDDRVRLWDVASGRRLGQVRHLPDCRPQGFLAGGKLLLIARPGKDCLLADGASLRVLGESEAARVGRNAALRAALEFPNRASRFNPRDEMNASALSPDGTVVASVWRAASECRIQLQELRSATTFASLAGHTGYVTALAFSPDGRRLASAGHDTTVLLWDVEELWAEHMLAELLAGGGDVGRLAARPGRVIIRLTAQLRRAARAEPLAARLIKDLDDDDFDVREKASAELGKLGVDAALALRRLLERRPSPEARARARRLLARIPEGDLKRVMNPGWVRRAVGVLRRLATPAARRALEELAERDRRTLVGQEARQAVEQLRAGGAKR
jgi:WD40 repeat protein